MIDTNSPLTHKRKSIPQHHNPPIAQKERSTATEAEGKHSSSLLQTILSIQSRHIVLDDYTIIVRQKGRNNHIFKRKPYILLRDNNNTSSTAQEREMRDSPRKHRSRLYLRLEGMHCTPQTCTHMHVPKYVYKCLHTRVHIYTRIHYKYTYTYTHIHTHIHTSSRIRSNCDITSKYRNTSEQFVPGGSSVRNVGSSSE